MNEELLKDIERLAGSQRAKTFRAAAEWIINNDAGLITETGCFRGADCDGMSTLILAKLAKEVSGILTSYDISEKHIQASQSLLQQHSLDTLWDFTLGDSVFWLSKMAGTIDFLYLDSFDHDPNNPGPCQRHQLAELGAAYGKLYPKSCAILLDDVDKVSGGKTLLSSAFLLERGWTLACESELQLFFTR